MYRLTYSVYGDDEYDMFIVKDPIESETIEGLFQELNRINDEDVFIITNESGFKTGKVSVRLESIEEFTKLDKSLFNSQFDEVINYKLEDKKYAKFLKMEVERLRIEEAEKKQLEILKAKYPSV